jgi:hypothetical protein
VNFKIKSHQKTFEFTSRNTIGSYGLFTNFTLLVEQTKKIQLLQFFTITNKEMVLDPTPILKAKIILPI